MPTNGHSTDTPAWTNATITARLDQTDELATFRIEPDGDLFDFIAGQYTVIGMPAAAERVSSADPEDQPPGKPDKLIMRAYSIASSSKEREYVELYIALVRSGVLTPRVWLLQPGDRIWLGPKAKGQFTLDDVAEGINAVLVGTGTGLAPYISMIRKHHRCNDGRKFAVVHGARYARDLGYRQELEALHCACGTLAYLPTVTRTTNDSDWNGHVGRVQSVFEDGALEESFGEPLSPETTEVFVSGNPEMVEDLTQILVARGFKLHSPRDSGTLHVERYW